MSWNAGHLGHQQWAEIKTWLRLEADKVCDVLILQETHWHESAEFTVSGWYCISSASKPTASQRKPRKENKQSQDPQSTSSAPSTTRADGLMVLLSPKFHAKQIRWKEWTTGRVLEVRAFLAGSRITFLAVYQHVWSSHKTQQDNKTDRASVLSSLTKAIKQVPQRDTLIVAGDFNSSLSSTQSLVGQQTVQPEDIRPDEASLTNLVKRLRLVALNTWHCHSPHTCVQGDSKTQIDFVFTREPSSGSLAKRASPLVDFYLGSWKKGGHLPILASVPTMQHWLLPKRKPGTLAYDQTALQASVRAGDETSQAMKRWVSEHIADFQDPDAWNSLLCKAVQQFYPKLRRTEADALETVTRRMWRTKIQASVPPLPLSDASALDESQSSGIPAQPPVHLPAQPSSPSAAAPASLDIPDRPSAQEQHRKAAKQAQKDRINRFLAEVDQNIADGDQHVAFKTLKLLRPWQPARRAQLKSASGHILSPQDELSTLSQYAADIFTAHPPLLPKQGPLPHLNVTDLARHTHTP